MIFYRVVGEEKMLCCSYSNMGLAYLLYTIHIRDVENKFLFDSHDNQSNDNENNKHLLYILDMFCITNIQRTI